MTAAAADNQLVTALAEAMPAAESQAQVVFRRFRRHKLAMAASVLLLLILLVSLFAKEIAPYGPTEIEVGNSFALPFSPASDPTRPRHYLGTDHLGRDYFSRIIYAARISLSVATTVTLGSVVVGSLIGAISGFYGGLLDDVFQRSIEFLLTIPTFPILLILSSILLQTPEAIPIPALLIDLLAAYPDGRMDRTDGLRVSWPDRWFHVRVSHYSGTTTNLFQALFRTEQSEERAAREPPVVAMRRPFVAALGAPWALAELR